MQRKHKLKMELEYLRSCIDLEKKEWINRYATNCYAYALGLDIPQANIIKYAYTPGIISNSDIYLPACNEFIYEDLINNIYLDLKALSIDFKEIDPTDKIDENEWKIAIFTAQNYGRLYDYHFLREHRDGIWYHKIGWNGEVSKYDCNGDVITNPKDCYIPCRSYKKCLSLKLK